LKIENIFVNSIFKTVVNNKKYKNFFLKKLKSCKNFNKISNVGGLQTQSYDNPPDEILKEIFLNPAYKFTEQLNPIKKIKLKLLNFWINSNRENNYNLLHCHKGFLSGVYYVQVPEKSGNLIFQNGDLIKMTNAYDAYFNNPNFWSSYIMPVQEGEIYLFTSTTLHYVEPNQSKKNRISVAFNLDIC
jgi:uncharacterized protein (TIGR02466 family)